MASVLEWERLGAAPGKMRANRLDSATLISGNRVLVLGLQTKNDDGDTLWEFNVQNEKWKRLINRGPFVTGVHHQSATLVGSNQLWIILGGQDPRYYDVHVLNTDTLEWTTPPLQSREEAQMAWHASVLHPLNPKCILVFGGYTSDGHWLGELSLLNTETLRWEKLRPGGDSPSPVKHHSLTAYGHRVLLFGETDYGTVQNELSVYDANENKWLKMGSVGERPGCHFSEPLAALASCGSSIAVQRAWFPHAFRDAPRETYSLDISRGDVFQWRKHDWKAVDSAGTRFVLDQVIGSVQCLVFCSNALYMLGSDGIAGGKVTMYVCRRPCMSFGRAEICGCVRRKAETDRKELDERVAATAKLEGQFQQASAATEGEKEELQHHLAYVEGKLNERERSLVDLSEAARAALD